MSFQTKQEINNAKFQQIGGSVLTLSGKTTIAGELRYAPSRVITGNTQLVDKLFVDLALSNFTGGTNITGGTNGLTTIGQTIKLGGTLTQENTTISGTSYNVNIQFGLTDGGITGIEAKSDQMVLKSPELYLTNYDDTKTISVDDVNANRIYLADNGLELYSDAAQSKWITSGGLSMTGAFTAFTSNDFVTRLFATSLDDSRQYKNSVKIATTGNTSTTNLITPYDGITLAANDRVLLWKQTTKSQNGIYRVIGVAGSNATITRAIDFGASTIGGVAEGATVLVNRGTESGNTFSLTATASTLTIGTSPMVFKKHILVTDSSVISVSSNTTIANTVDTVLVSSSGGTVTITLPSSPNPNRKITIKDRTGNALTNNITVNGNGRNIDGSSTAILNTNRASIQLTYSSQLNQYYVTGFVN